MGLLDAIREKLAPHGDKAEQAVDKAAEVVDHKTGGKHSGQVDAGAEKAKDALGINKDKHKKKAAAEAPPAPPAEKNPPA